MNIFELIKGRAVIASIAAVDTCTAVAAESAAESDSVAVKGISCAMIIDSCDELECFELNMNDSDFLVDLLS